MSQALQPYNPQPVAQANSDAELVELWLRTKQSPKTRKEYRRDVRGLIEWIELYRHCEGIGRIRLGELQAYQEALAELRRNTYDDRPHYSPNSIRRKLNAIKSLFSFAKKIGYIQFDVAAALTLPKAKNTLAERILSESDVIKMIALEPNPRNQLLIRLLYLSAARVSECVSLRWRDLQGVEDGGQVTLYGKGQKTRAVRLPAKLYNHLLMVREARNCMIEDFVFPGRRTKRKARAYISTDQVRNIVASAAKRAGIALPVSPHWLRHAHASHALQNGAAITLVQATLGHESVATTGMYTHARPEDSSALHLKID